MGYFNSVVAYFFVSRETKKNKKFPHDKIEASKPQFSNVLVWGGIGAAGVYAGPSLASIGITGASTGIIIGALGSASSKAGSKGIWIKIGGNHLSGWGYQ